MDIHFISTKELIKNNKSTSRKVNPSKFLQILGAEKISEQEKKEPDISEAKVNLVSKINSYLILNEIDPMELEKKKLKDISEKLIGSLNQIRLGLLNNSITKHHVNLLKSSLDEGNYSFESTEIQALVDEIKLRALIELAKIEKNMV